MNTLTQQDLYNNAWQKYCKEILPYLTFISIFLICAIAALIIFWIGWTARGKRIDNDFDSHADKVAIQKIADKDAMLDYKDLRIEDLERQLKEEKQRNKIIDKVKA